MVELKKWSSDTWDKQPFPSLPFLFLKQKKSRFVI
jgi:hypothetical protein